MFVVDILVEYGSGGSIRSLLDRFERFEERVASLYIKQILDGLAYVHALNIIHRDIKGANILLDATGVIKISDFGCCKRLSITDDISEDDNRVPLSIRGSPYWMAPEVMKLYSKQK